MKNFPIWLQVIIFLMMLAIVLYVVGHFLYNAVPTFEIRLAVTFYKQSVL